MVTAPFSIGRLSQIEFGEGSLGKVSSLVAALGKRALLVTGSKSFSGSPHWSTLVDSLDAAGVSWAQVRVEGEPSPQCVDQAVREFRRAGIEVVLAAGGGSALDAGKAVAALLPSGRSVMEHLEGVGPEIPYRGPALPSIMVPTTAGTGREVTRNSVLSVRGRKGFKKSFRHDDLTPRYAVVDPQLLTTCPRETIAASCIDAVTQLIESFVSARSNPFTDALAMDGLRAARQSLLPWHEGGKGGAHARSGMAYAALVSGIALSHAGLGAVHGLASPLGAFFHIPHGVVCGTLLHSVTETNIRAMEKREPRNASLDKYYRLGAVLAGEEPGESGEGRDALVRTLSAWTERLDIPRLGSYGVRERDLDEVIRSSRGGSMRTNPIALNDSELREILERRL